MKLAALLVLFVACSGSSPPALTTADVEAALGVIQAVCRRIPLNARPELVAVCAVMPVAEVRPFPLPEPPMGVGGNVPVSTDAGSGGSS